MSLPSSVSSADAAVEVLDWTPHWSLGSVAANFARMQMLVSLFDGDPDKWLTVIEQTGSADDEEDVPFLQSVKQRMGNDATFIDDMRRIISEFAARFASHDRVE